MTMSIHEYVDEKQEFSVVVTETRQYLIKVQATQKTSAMEKLYDFIRSHKGWDSLWQIALGKRKPNSVITDVMWEDAVTVIDSIHEQGEWIPETSLLERVISGGIFPKDDRVGADCSVISANEKDLLQHPHVMSTQK